jgi:signal transduction histidine kinase
VGGEVAILCLLDPPAERVTVAATSGAEDAFVASPQVLTSNSPEFTLHAMEEAIQREGANCPILHPHFLLSHLAVPLRVGNRIVGGLCVGHREASRFGEEQLYLLTLLADAGAIALENARAYERAEQEARLVERERLLAEIHDGLAQTLSFLNLRLKAVQDLIASQHLSQVPEHLALTQRTVEQAEREAQRLMSSLHASKGSLLTFQEQLSQAIEQFAEECQLEVEVQLEPEVSIHDPPEVREQVRRIVLEALTNASKHAPGSRVTVSLERREGETAVCIADNGPGFEPSAVAGQRGHFGLKVMQARAERIGGALTVASTPGRGTSITLRWPVQEQEVQR